MFIQHLLSSTLYSSDNEITVTPISRTFFSYLSPRSKGPAENLCLVMICQSEFSKV